MTVGKNRTVFDSIAQRKIGELTVELENYKLANRQLLAENVDLKIEVERLRKKVELYGCFIDDSDGSKKAEE